MTSNGSNQNEAPLEKDLKKLAVTASKAKSKSGTTKTNTQATAEHTEEEFYRQRLSQLGALPAKDFYPHKFKATHTIAQAYALAAECATGTSEGPTVAAAGRVVVCRGQKSIFFIKVMADGAEIQLAVHAATEEPFKEAELIRRGDIVGFVGPCGRTRTGEPSVFPVSLQILAPCL